MAWRWRRSPDGVGGASPAPSPAFDRHPTHTPSSCDWDDAESRELAASRVTRVEASRLESDGASAALEPALSELARHVSRVYLHIDLDVHDPAEAQANQYAVPGGLSARTVRDLVRVVADRFTVVAAALTAYDPAFDNRMLNVGQRLMEEIAGGI